MTDRIRVGIVGATTRKTGSGWGANAHIPALRNLPDYELVAVTTAHQESARESAQEFGARLAFHDAAEMVAEPDIDLVVVVVRVPRHEEIVSLAIEAGKAVFCEWPLATSRAEAERMAEAARRHGVVTAVGLQARSDPAVAQARQLLDDGAIGEILAVNLQVVTPNDVERPGPRMWQGAKAAGANPLTIAGGHALDVVQFLLGDIAEFSSRIATRVGAWTDTDTGESRPVDAPDVVQLIGVLADGAELAAQISGLPGAAPAYRLQAHGSRGMLQLSGAFLSGGPSGLALRRPGSDLEPVAPAPESARGLESVPPGPGRNVASAYLRLARALGGAGDFRPSFEDAVTLHALLEDISEGGRSAQRS